MAMSHVNEKAFETAIEDHLLSAGHESDKGT
jgi:hypothetical protein